jgi:hypothetical protein
MTEVHYHRGKLAGTLIEVEPADVEALFEKKKGTRKTCYEKSCLRKPTVRLILELGDGSIVIKEDFCEKCEKELEVFGWQRVNL